MRIEPAILQKWPKTLHPFTHFLPSAFLILSVFSTCCALQPLAKAMQLQPQELYPCLDTLTSPRIQSSGWNWNIGDTILSKLESVKLESVFQGAQIFFWTTKYNWWK